MNENRNYGRLFWGLALIAVGVFLMLERIGGLPEWMYDYSWWGGIVVLLGLGTIVTARRAESVGSGITFVLLGVWFLAVTNRMYGLSWSNSWPLALVAAGAGTLGHAIAANWLPDTRRERRIRRGAYVEVVDDSRENAPKEGPHA
jgi:hypothetical protein